MHTYRRPAGSNTGKLIAIAIVGITLLIILSAIWAMSSERVSAGEACVVRRNGKAIETAMPGRVWMTPVIEDLECYTTREVALEYTGGETNTQYTDSVISQQSKDGRDVSVASLVKFQVDPEALIDIHNNKAKSMSALVDRIKPVIRSEVRAAINDTPIAEIYPGGLTALADKARPGIEEALKPYGVVLTDFDLTRIDPDDEYEAAIRSQQQAEEDRELAIAQQAAAQEQAEKKRIEAEGEANAVIEQANGDAEAKRVQADADAYVKTTNAKAEATANEQIAASLTPELVQLKYYEALTKAKWAIFSPEDVMPMMPVETPSE